MTLLLLLAALLAWALASAQADKLPVDITASADKQSITVGDVLSYQVEVTAPAGARISVPDPEKALAPYEVRDQSSFKSVQDGKLKVTFIYKLAVFEVGEKPISNLKVSCQLPGEKRPRLVSVPSVKITVASVLTPDSKDIKDIRDPIPITTGPAEWIAAALLALAVLIPAALILRWLVRRARRAPVQVAEPVFMSSHERAARELAALRSSGLLESGDLKGFYTRLSEILREYLEARFEVPAMEETTRMIQRDLERMGVAEQWREGIIAVLYQADLVKFARQEVDDAHALADLDRALRCVEGTRAITSPASSDQEPAIPAVS